MMAPLRAASKGVHKGDTIRAEYRSFLLYPFTCSQMSAQVVGADLLPYSIRGLHGFLMLI